MKYHEMTKNYIFREFECGLSVEDTAELCFKSVRTIKGWDSGKEIPKECKRLMRKQRCLELSYKDEWKGFCINNELLQLPTGQLVTPQEILTGIALLEIKSELEIKTSKKLLKLARAIARLK
ncbi:phage protein [Vibrio europaeus]|uniref:Phage protein n=1 Tax=Vibrio europaeus TaxID=300876 RepID=A0A178JFF5_9VIBR|nr:phage protein [Vibrio europaeus]MDC5706391.1 phage protein [Vibrio europaeus]MDC5711706.1 phage protein [Vibrio europaeus]MDC5716181.1 phage protein [Vibrio europaeus]MDC5723192.1 phage protein [Vibrio europaeus]MDC5728411.1 phage protein [Vibrio europaeus]